MWKAIFAGTTALVIAGSSLVYAQQRGGRPDGMQRGPNSEDMRAFAEATGPLYTSLDDSQKRRFAFLGRMRGGGGRDFGGPQFRGRDDGGPDFRDRDRGGPDFRGRDGDGPRGFERRFRRTENGSDG